MCETVKSGIYSFYRKCIDSRILKFGKYLLEMHISRMTETGKLHLFIICKYKCILSRYTNMKLGCLALDKNSLIILAARKKNLLRCKK